MRLFNYKFLLILLFGILNWCQLQSQTQIFLANTASGVPCDNPPCDPISIDPYGDVYNDPSHYHLGDNFLTSCYLDDSLSGKAGVVVSFELNNTSTNLDHNLS